MPHNQIHKLGITDEIKPQASLVLRRDPNRSVINEEGDRVGAPVSALQFTSVGNILSQSVADVAARDDVRTGATVPTPAPTGISEPAPTPEVSKPFVPKTGFGAFAQALTSAAPFISSDAEAPVDTAIDAIAPSAITPGLFTPPARGIITPVEEIPDTAPVLGDIDFSSIEGLVKGVGSVAEFTQNLQKFNRSRGISPGGGGNRRGIKTSDIQGRIKFLQERLTGDLPLEEKQQTEVTDELDILNQFIQSRLGVKGARDKSRAEDEARITKLIASIRADK